MQWLRAWKNLPLLIHRFLLDQLVMHDGEMGGCTAEADPPELEPENATLPRRKAAAGAAGL